MTPEERVEKLYEDLSWCLGKWEPGWDDDPKPILAAAIRAAVAEEREACSALARARVLSDMEAYNSFRECYGGDSSYCLSAVASMTTAQDIENAIRARGDS